MTTLGLLLGLLSIIFCRTADGLKWRAAPSWSLSSGARIGRWGRGLASTTEQQTAGTQEQQPGTEQKLTQKEYLIAVRNRLFAVEEQIWLHEYALARPQQDKIVPFSQSKYDALLRARGDLLDEYPVTRLYTDLRDAQQRNMTYAAMHLERLITNFNRQMPVPMVHVNQIAVLSHSGQVMNLMRGQGTVYHRLLPSNSFASSADSKVKRQFQQPAFSHQGRYLALAEMHFKDSSVVRSDALVFEVPKESQSFGASDSMPLFASGDLPGAPFFMRFSPDDETLAMLCSQPAATQPPQQAKSEGESEGTNATPSSASASASSEVTTSLVLLDWARYQRRDEWGRNSAMPGNRNPAKANAPRPPGLAARKALTVLRGSPVFFTYTTSSAKNATIVAHCQQEVSDPQTQSMVTERAVWMLQRGDTSGVADFSWKKISAEAAGATPSVRWSTPICHSAGGGDSVLLVEDGWLVSKSLSRWKRGQEDALPRTKKLMQVRGAVQFLVSADSSRAVVLQEDIAGGFFRLSVLEGEKGLDPCDPSPPVFYDLPCPKLTVAFWLSPDSTKVLLLTAAGRTVEDVSVQKGQTRVALNSDMQWSVFNFPLRELREYEAFKPTPYFMKTHVPFFSQYAQVFNPWAPDSRSFIYVTPTGLMHTPLVGSKHCLGEDKWQNQGASFGTWTRH